MLFRDFSDYEGKQPSCLTIRKSTLKKGEYLLHLCKVINLSSQAIFSQYTRPMLWSINADNGVCVMDGDVLYLTIRVRSPANERFNFFKPDMEKYVLLVSTPSKFNISSGHITTF